RTIPIPPRPGGVDTATIVSSSKLNPARSITPDCIVLARHNSVVTGISIAHKPHRTYTFVVRQGGSMGKINLGRVVYCGIIAGIVLNILAYIVDGLLLAREWADGMQALGRPPISSGQIIWLNLFGFVGGIFIVWLYAAIRPRFGPGMK